MTAAALSISYTASGDQDRVPLPTIAPAKGERCVEPTEVMRRDHMKFILHQRDETVHEGIRTKRHSLKECIDCHVTPGADGQTARVESREHFCNSCHSYAAVKIDCFQCHSSQPEAQTATAPLAQRQASLPALQLFNAHGQGPHR